MNLFESTATGSVTRTGDYFVVGVERAYDPSREHVGFYDDDIVLVNGRRMLVETVDLANSVLYFKQEPPALSPGDPIQVVHGSDFRPQ